MSLDEQSLRDALHGIASEPKADLSSQARRGGQRRVLRRRAGVATGALALGAAAVPAIDAVRSGGSAAGEIGPAQHQSSPRVYSGLYAAPPAPGSQCNTGFSGSTDPSGRSLASRFPELLLLPSNIQTSYAFVRSERQSCPPAHDALTAVQTDRVGNVTRGVVVEGPNAATAVEDGRAGPGVGFGGQTGHQRIEGQPGVEFTITENDHTDAYWTEPDGGQWHAEVHGLTQNQAVALLDDLRLDPSAGTASLAGSIGNEWTVEPPAADVSQTQGIVYSRWHDGLGHQVDMTATQTPDRTEQRAAGADATLAFTTIRGHRATLMSSARDIDVTWQESSDVEVTLDVARADLGEVKQVAASLTLASPSDPRFHG